VASGRDGDARGVWSISGRIDCDDEQAVNLGPQIMSSRDSGIEPTAPK